MSRRRYKIHVVSHTRWEREWHRTFQSLRLEQVQIMDALLDRLTTQDEYSSFLLDGQVILLHDYLEVRPEQSTLIADLVRENRLEIGPWYVVPDEFLVSAEALIRNLEHGIQTAARFGGWLDVGYIPSSSGHIAQMPQILRQFGIESAAVVQGLGDAPAELWWEAPDGSRVLLCYLRNGYDSSRLLAVQSEDASAFIKAQDELRMHSSSDASLLMTDDARRLAADGLAHVMEAVQAQSGPAEFLSSSLHGYVSDVRTRDQNDISTVVGELRSSQRFPLRFGASSARMDLKQQNHDVQTLLERWAEPFSAWASYLDHMNRGSLNGRNARVKSPSAFNRLAWSTLLQNHHHESIGGGCIDDVAADIQNRLDQAGQIAAEIASQNMRFIARQVTPLVFKGRSSPLSLIVFNGAGHQATDAVMVELRLPANYCPFEILDDAGRPVPFDLVMEPHDGGNGTLEVAFTFTATGVPAIGYRTYALRKIKAWPEPSLTDNEPTIENEFYRLNVDRHTGLLALFIKATGQLYEGLNRFSDGGDRGDTGTHCPPERDAVIESPTNTPLFVERQIGASYQSLTFLQIFRVPNELTPDRRGRLPLAAQFVPLPIMTTVYLRQAVPRVDISASITNNAKDHRLRVHFPTGIVAQEALVDGHFEIVSRDAMLPDVEDTSEWAEQPAPEMPQRAFVTIQGDESGLTIANRGLPEVAVLSSRGGTEIALTLLRCVGWLNRNDLHNRQPDSGPQIEVPGAQCIREFDFDYSLIPHGADPLPAWRQAWSFQTPLRAELVVGKSKVRRSHPPLASLADVDNPCFVVSAVKEGRDGSGLIVRGYNISQQAEPVRLHVGVEFDQVERVRLDEQILSTPVAVGEDGAIEFVTQPGEIVTILLH